MMTERHEFAYFYLYECVLESAPFLSRHISVKYLLLCNAHVSRDEPAR